MQINHSFDPDSRKYIIACARIRNITMTQLLRLVVETVAKEQLVQAVLDDDSHHDRAKSEHRFHEPRDRV